MFKSILLIACLFVAQAIVAQDQPKQATLVVKTPNSCDHCKVCESCGLKLETDLYYVRGIKRVEYDQESQTTTIVYKTKLLTPEQIRREIVQLGFDADELKADPAAYAKRDGCCK